MFRTHNETHQSFAEGGSGRALKRLYACAYRVGEAIWQVTGTNDHAGTVAETGVVAGLYERSGDSVSVGKEQIPCLDKINRHR